jgi:hypothetical protein
MWAYKAQDLDIGGQNGYARGFSMGYTAAMMRSFRAKQAAPMRESAYRRAKRLSLAQRYFLSVKRICLARCADC